MTKALNVVIPTTHANSAKKDRAATVEAPKLDKKLNALWLVKS